MMDQSLNVLTPEASSLENAEVQKLFRTRLKTFIDAQKWVHKPLALSPAVCARYGWKCVSSQLLECVACCAKLSTGQLKLDSLQSYNACLEKVQECLRSSHKKLCPWPVAPCAESFVHMVPMHKEEALKEFSKRLKSLLSFDCQLPVIKEGIPEKLGLTEQLCNSLFNLSKVESRNFCLSAVILAATGWRKDFEAKQKRCLTCFNCQRSVALFLYTSIEGADREITGHISEQSSLSRVLHKKLSTKNCNETVKEECLKNGQMEQQLLEQEDMVVDRDSPTKAGRKRTANEQSGCEDIEQVAKRKRLSMPEVGAFDPLYEHRPWCPWVIESTVRERLSDSSPTSLKDGGEFISLPGWKLFVKCLLRNVGCGEVQEDSSPMKQQLLMARNMLESWNTPS